MVSGIPQAEPGLLIVADNTSARFGGEAILPLIYFKHLSARGRRVFLITHERNRDELTAMFPGLISRMEFSPDTATHRALWRVGAKLPGTLRDHLIGNLMGVLTNWQQRRMAREIIAREDLALVHQPIPVSPAAPSLLHSLGVPVVMGPMNGGMTYPPGYEDYESRISLLFLKVGRKLAGLVNALIPGKRRAARLMVANVRTKAALPIQHGNVITLAENGVDLSLWDGAQKSPAIPNHIRLVFMGRLIALKGLNFGLEAIAMLRQSRPDLTVTLDVLGDGDARGALEAQVAELGLADAVRFHGFLPQVECAEQLARADVLLLPSLRECGGAVVLEAMALGLPTLVADWGGPADYVDDTTGVLVSPTPRDSFAQRLAGAIERLADDPEARDLMGEAGRQKVLREFDWANKIDVMEQIYRDAIAESGRGAQ